MSFENMKRRLRKLQDKSGARDAVLMFRDGSVRAIRPRDPLGLVLASFRRRHSEIEGGPMPESRYDEHLNLLGKCTSVDSEAPLIDLAASCLHSKNR